MEIVGFVFVVKTFRLNDILMKEVNGMISLLLVIDNWSVLLVYWCIQLKRAQSTDMDQLHTHIHKDKQQK